jgi:hypothetical protein
VLLFQLLAGGELLARCFFCSCTLDVGGIYVVFDPPKLFAGASYLKTARPDTDKIRVGRFRGADLEQS